MLLSNLTVLLTGATGGIGNAIASDLLEHGAAVLLVGRNAAGLQATASTLSAHGERAATHAADVTHPEQREELAVLAARWRGGINVLINNAGVCDFALLEQQSPTHIDSAFAVNAQAPIHLCRALLPSLRTRPSAAIVNIGSVFGAIGHPGYAVYCATKFALRGFTEALRRELSHTNVRVHYLAPRATRTAMNSDAVNGMNAALGVATDPPPRVARSLRRMLESERPSATIGQPESIFVRLNALAPRPVDRAMQKQLPVVYHYAMRGKGP